MKKALTVLLAATLGLFIFSGCEESKVNNNLQNNNQEEQQEEVPISSLKGKWTGYCSATAKCYVAFVDNERIVVALKDGLNDWEPRLFWVGSFVDTDKEVTSYEFESIGASWEEKEAQTKRLNEMYKDTMYQFQAAGGYCDDFVQKNIYYRYGKLYFLKNSDREYDKLYNPYIYLEKVE